MYHRRWVDHAVGADFNHPLGFKQLLALKHRIEKHIQLELQVCVQPVLKAGAAAK